MRLAGKRSRATPPPRARRRRAVAARRPDQHPAEGYAADVLAGRVVVNKWVRLAVERHQRDLREAKRRGLVFDRAAGVYAITFIERFCRHSKGEWAGRPLTLSPWQQFFLWVLFGWKRADGTRRFRTAWLEVARKNGKSTLAAGLALLLLVADHEAGAEVYSVATKKDQAKIVWGEAERMVKASPELRTRVATLRNNLSVVATHSKLEPLSSDENTLDGLNPHGAIADEVHAWRNRLLWDVMETATGSRRQPLLIAITTAGFDRTSVAFENHEYAQKVLQGLVPDDSFFALIYAIDDEDRWEDEACWPKANPNLGVSVKVDDLRRKAVKAKEMPAAQNALRRLHLNQWTEQQTRWIDLDLWDAGARDVDLATLAGRPCYAALDLSSTTDLSALALVFPPAVDETDWRALLRFWLPRDNMAKRVRTDRVPYDVWADQGWIRLTDGNVIDYDVIRADVRELAELVEIREVAFDRWNATQLSTQLAGDGFTMVEFGQGFASMAAPTRALEEKLVGRTLAHGGNPVLRWMAMNVTVQQDAAGNRKPDKGKSRERIDGIVALLMALGRATVAPAEGESVYEDEDLFILGDD